MKNLKTLIKLHKNNLNQLLKQISILQNNQTAVENKLSNLLSEIKEESEKFLSTEYGFVLDQYLINARAKKEDYQNSIETLQAQIKATQILINDEFGETKKLEIALQNRENKAKELEKFVEAKELDEINILKYEKS